MTRCPTELPRLAGATGNDFDATLRAFTVLYTACAARHNQLTTEIHQREALP